MRCKYRRPRYLSLDPVDTKQWGDPDHFFRRKIFHRGLRSLQFHQMVDVVPYRPKT